MSLYSNHKALTFLKKCKHTSARLREWALTSEPSHLNIVHNKFTENIAADYFSWNIAAEKDKPFQEVAIVAAFVSRRGGIENDLRRQLPATDSDDK